MPNILAVGVGNEGRRNEIAAFETGRLKIVGVR